MPATCTVNLGSASRLAAASSCSRWMRPRMSRGMLTQISSLSPAASTTAKSAPVMPCRKTILPISGLRERTRRAWSASRVRSRRSSSSKSSSSAADTRSRTGPRFVVASASSNSSQSTDLDDGWVLRFAVMVSALVALWLWLASPRRECVLESNASLEGMNLA